jgi:hypothetical protein
LIFEKIQEKLNKTTLLPDAKYGNFREGNSWWLLGAYIIKDNFYCNSFIGDNFSKEKLKKVASEYSVEVKKYIEIVHKLLG